MESMTINEPRFAKLVGLSLDNVRQRRRAGELPHIRVGKRVLYTPEIAAKFLSDHTQNAHQPA